MKFVRPQPFHEALQKLGSKSIVGSKLNSEQWTRVPKALRDRAFFSARVESARFLQRARNTLADFLNSAKETVAEPAFKPDLIGPVSVLKTGSRADFIKQLQDFALNEGLGTIEPGETPEATKVPNDVTNLPSERRLGLIFDVQTRQAQDYGYWKQGVADPDVLNAFPAQRFIRVRPVKEPRDMHQHHEGEVHLKSDITFWTALNQDFGVPWGPWGWGCGHDVEDVDRAEAESLGLIRPGQTIRTPEIDFNARLQSSVENLDTGMQRALVQHFGNQVHIQNGSAHWVQV
jgi:hypothetical protein